VWLILAIVLLFTCFPPAFARLGTLLHIPLSLVLIGVVLRGSAFTFWRYGADEEQRHWGVVFAIASLITPFLLGTTAGTIASGALGEAGGATLKDSLTVEGDGFYRIYVAPWLNPFPLSVGLFALITFAFLAAVYLTLEAHERELQEDFRRRALAAGVGLFLAAVMALLFSLNGAPRVRDGLIFAAWALPFHLLTAALARGARGGRDTGVAHPVGLGAEPVSLHPAARSLHRGRGRARGYAAARAGRTRVGRGRVAAVALLFAARVQELSQSYLAYWSAPRKCSDTYGSVPSTQLS